MPASREMRAYLEPIVAKRRENPEDDLVSDIVHAEIDGEKLSDEHVYGFLRLLLPAGAETTFRVMGSTLMGILSHPGMVQRCLDDPSRIDRAIEETLRWETSVTMVNREALEEVEISGTTVPQGASVIVCTGSANHDETRFEDPENFDPDAERKAHIAFGTGRHQCLGMHLARLELRVGISQVLGETSRTCGSTPMPRRPESKASHSGRRPRFLFCSIPPERWQETPPRRTCRGSRRSSRDFQRRSASTSRPGVANPPSG